jgi:hypothetical protein
VGYMTFSSIRYLVSSSHFTDEEMLAKRS